MHVTILVRGVICEHEIEEEIICGNAVCLSRQLIAVTYKRLFVKYKQIFTRDYTARFYHRLCIYDAFFITECRCFIKTRRLL